MELLMRRVSRLLSFTRLGSRVHGFENDGVCAAFYPKIGRKRDFLNTLLHAYRIIRQSITSFSLRKHRVFFANLVLPPNWRRTCKLGSRTTIGGDAFPKSGKKEINEYRRGVCSGLRRVWWGTYCLCIHHNHGVWGGFQFPA